MFKKLEQNGTYTNNIKKKQDSWKSFTSPKKKKKLRKISLTIKLSLPYLGVLTFVWILHNVFPEIFSKTWDIFTQKSV